MQRGIGRIVNEAMKRETGIDFATVRRSPSRNDYLACPVERCGTVPDGDGLRFAVPADTVYAAAREVLAREPRTTIVGEQPAELRLVLVQRSPLLRFPDVVAVQTFARPEGGTDLAMYSRSVYGRWDWGVNGRRVLRWLGLIAARVAAGAGQDRGGDCVQSPRECFR